MKIIYLSMALLTGLSLQAGGPNSPKEAEAYAQEVVFDGDFIINYFRNLPESEANKTFDFVLSIETDQDFLLEQAMANSPEYEDLNTPATPAEYHYTTSSSSEPATPLIEQTTPESSQSNLGEYVELYLEGGYRFVDGPGKCSCGTEYLNEEGFDKHLKEKHKNKNSRVYFCGEKCNRQCDITNMKKHMRAVHTNETPYKCNSCPHESNSEGNMKKHVEICKLNVQRRAALVTPTQALVLSHVNQTKKRKSSAKKSSQRKKRAQSPEKR